MNAKKIVTVVLLLFVIVSVVFLLAKEFTTKKNPSGDSNLDTSKITQINNLPVRGRKIVVYYFHRTVRCPTCIKLEEYSHEAIKSGFANEIEKGRLEWKSINIEDAGNEHFENDFKLYSQSLVIEEIRNGKQHRWKNLEKIWELVDIKEAYLRYVENEVNSFLEGNS